MSRRSGILWRAFRAARRFAADAVRVGIAFATLNTRKSVWRWRGRRSRCPCQNPGDSGRPMETHCDAVMLWPRPGRLRHVCPALRVTARGYMCAVATADVKPYWGRTLGYYAGAVGALALAAATFGFAGLRLTGVREVTWVDCAWPGRWSNVARARSRYFCAQSVQALGRGDFALARVALSSAIEADPRNYDAAMLMTMLSSLSPQRQLSDASFQWLLEQHPEQANRTAVMFHDALLAQGRADQLAEFALWIAEHDKATPALWVRSLVSALRLSGHAAAFARTHGADLRKLPRPARSLIAAQILVEQHEGEMARAALRRPLAAGDPIYTLLQVEALLRLGETGGATVVKNSLPQAGNDFYGVALQYWIEKEHGNDVFAQLCFTSLITRNLTTEQLDWATALLVRAPDVRSYRLLDARVRRSLAPTQQTAAGMWAAAAVCRDAAAEEYWSEALRAQANVQLPHDLRFDFASLSPEQSGSVPAVLNRVSLPRETIDALLARVTLRR